MKKEDGSRDAGEKQDGPESKGTFYCALVKGMQTLRQSPSRAIAWASSLDGPHKLGVPCRHMGGLKLPPLPPPMAPFESGSRR